MLKLEIRCIRSRRSKRGAGEAHRNKRDGFLLVLTVFVLASTVFWASPANAYFVKYAHDVVAKAYGDFFGDVQTINTGEVAAISVIQPPVTATSVTASASATATLEGETSLGRIRTRASGTVLQAGPQVPPSFYNVTDASSNGGFPEFADTLTMSDGTFNFTLDLTSSVSGSPTSLTSGTTEPGADCGLTNADAVFIIDAPPPINLVSPLTFEFAGAQVDINGRLEVRNFGDSKDGVSVTGTVDVINTADFFITPVSPGASYVSESGVSYVPEPSTLLSRTFALTMLAILSRLRQRKRTTG
jgi:hypothetical protein